MTQHDPFDDSKDGNALLGSVGPKAAFFIVLIALSFMIGVVWKLYSGGGDTGSNVPVVRADSTPYKVDPEDPGGMEMPNKDSTIFSSLNSDPDRERGVENLLAETTVEEPVSRTELFAGLNTEPSPDLHAEAHDTPLDKPLSEDQERIMADAEVAKKIVSNLVDNGADALVDDKEKEDAVEVMAEKIVEEPAEKLEMITEPKEVLVEPKPVVKKEEPKKVEAPKPEPKKEASKVTEKTLAKGGSYIQLASITDRSATGAEWAKLKAKYGSILSGYKYRVETADLGAKGVYHRIQAGPVSKAQAQETCAAIKKKTPGGCLVK